MSNKENKKVVSLKREYEGYVSLDEYNKIKYDLYRKEKEIENLKHNMNYWYNECIKLSNNQNIDNQFRYNFDYYENMRRQLTNESNQIINRQTEKIYNMQSIMLEDKDKEIERLENDKEENNKLKDKEIERLENEKEKLNDKNIKLENKIKQIINYYIDGKDIKEIILNLLKVNDKDGE